MKYGSIKLMLMCQHHWHKQWKAATANSLGWTRTYTNVCKQESHPETAPTFTKCGLCAGPLSSQLCPALSHSTSGSLPGPSAHGLSQTRILEQVAVSSSGLSSAPRDRTRVSRSAGRFLTAVPPRKPNVSVTGPQKFKQNWKRNPT